jgi:hypothetical protein
MNVQFLSNLSVEEIIIACFSNTPEQGKYFSRDDVPAET